MAKKNIYQIPYDQKMQDAFIADAFLEYHDEIMRYLCGKYRGSLSEDQLEDVISDSFEAFINNVRSGKLTEQTCSIRSYLITICINQANKLIERELSVTKKTQGENGETKGHVARFAQLPESRNPEEPGIDEGQIARILGTTEDNCDQEECFYAIRESVNTIGEKCRQILLSIFWDNLSHSEIAEMMGYNNAKVVKTKANRCRNIFYEKNKKLLDICCR